MSEPVAPQPELNRLGTTYWEERCQILEERVIRLARLLTYHVPAAFDQVSVDEAKHMEFLRTIAVKYPKS